MTKPRPCGCKGCRTCLICETEHGADKLKLQLDFDKTKGYVYCPLCNKAWKGWDMDLYKQHPNHEGKSIDYPGIYIQLDFLSKEEEESFMENIDEMPWDISQSGRRKQNFGPKTNFKKNKVVPGNFEGFPAFSKFIQDRFNNIEVLKSYQVIEQCSLEYDPSKGASIDPHIDDCWIWGERIVTVNCLSDSILTLTRFQVENNMKKYNLYCAENYHPIVNPDGNVGSGYDNLTMTIEATRPKLDMDVIIRIPMPRRSLLVLYGEPRYHWEHCVLREDITSRRVCIAYREFTPFYLKGGKEEAIGDIIREKARTFWDHRTNYNMQEAREFEQLQPSKPRGQTKRSQAWKSARQSKKVEEKKDYSFSSYDFRANDETSPIDEPIYDLGPHGSSIPLQEYSQNSDFSGYVDLVERTYESLRRIDPRLDRRMPFSMFQHSMCTILNCYLIDLTTENGERKLESGLCQDLLPKDLVIPDVLYHYITNVQNTTTVEGLEVRFNLPDAAVPQPAFEEFPSGSFGPINAQNHNIYECYISPLITANRVLNSRRGPDELEIPPLLAQLVPERAQPTRNLLGHGPADILPAEARPRIEGFNFPDGDSVVARLKICPELMARVNTVLFELRTRFKMRDIGRKITQKHIPGFVQYVTVTEDTPDHVKLSTKQVQIAGPAAFGSTIANQNNITCLRRERTAQARGLCYTVNGAAPQGWEATINNNFNMLGDFAPTIGADNAAIRVMRFVSHAPGGSRLITLDNYIQRNFFIR